MSTSEKQPTPMPKVEPQKEHQWLTKLTGEWTFEGNCVTGPETPTETFSGTETISAIGEIWVVGVGEGSVPGAGASTWQTTLGFNPQTNRFVGTWVASMMTHMWLYDGSLDESGRILTLEAEGPDMTKPDQMAKYRDVVEMVDDDTRVIRSEAQVEDGSWTQIMSSTYRRKK